MPFLQEMETPQSPPSKIARLTDFSSCFSMEKNTDTCRSVSTTIGLGLALGSSGGGGGGGSNTIDHRPITKSEGFTILQLQELQLQSLIYKYIEAGFPVPYHLVLPIWKSVSTSLSSSLHQHYPTLMIGNHPMHMEYRNGMDPEPGRCRRTDGKKWRCSKEAVPDHKYCERHMHRGRQRSRKLVEPTSQTTTTTNLSISLHQR